MRLPLGILILLCSAAAAFAEPAWVLWDQSVYAVEGQEPAVLWSQWGSFTTKDACEEGRRKEVGTYDQASKLFPNDWSKQGDTILQMDKGKVLRRTTYYCYAATTNPRLEYLASKGDWYLMGPPRTDYDKTAAYLRGYQVLSNRALNEWVLLDAFESQQVCESMRDFLRRAEESTYSKAATHYSQMMGQQTETPTLLLQRFMVEMYHANVRTYTASRCVSRGSPGLPQGLKTK
jgi:hypothetical protein